MVLTPLMNVFGQFAPCRNSELTGSESQRTLVGVLLNPPATSTGTRSRNAVARAAGVLGYEKSTLTNMCAVPTSSVAQVNALDPSAWELARHELNTALSEASAVLAGWGVSGLSGSSLRLMQAQVRWLAESARQRGIGAFWMVGGEPRHPSRWHQYVADKYARTSGGTFEERLAQVLVAVPIFQAFPSTDQQFSQH